MEQHDKYRIVVSIIRGTAAGRALSLMANGLIVVAPTWERAVELKDQYLDAASPILATADQGVVFGVITMIDLQAGSVQWNECLVGRAEVVRDARGTKGRLTVA